MRYWTWAEIKTKIENETDTEDEDFVDKDEVLSYANEAIDEAEAEIHGIYEDYFLTMTPQAITGGDEEISLPDDIYAHKIRRVIFVSTGGSVYTVVRTKDWKKFEMQAVNSIYGSTDLLQYFIINSTPGEPKMLLSPKVTEAGTLKIWHIRNANRLVADTDICDIPEFVSFVIAFVRWKIYSKEGHPGLQDAERALEKQRALMVGTLQAMVPDAENEIELDVTPYDDMN